MPKEASHILTALTVRSRLEKKLAQDSRLLKAITKYPASYYFGSIGPDFLYYDIISIGDLLPLGFTKRKIKVEEWADFIHGYKDEATLQHIRSLAYLVKNIKSLATLPQWQGKWNKNISNDDVALIMLAFIAGYLTHVALDTIFHPAVFYLTGEYHSADLEIKNLAEVRHRMIETLADLFVLDKVNLNPHNFAASKKTKLSGGESSVIFNLYGAAMFSNSSDSSEDLIIQIESDDHKQKIIAAKRSYRKQRLLMKLIETKVLQSQSVSRFLLKAYGGGGSLFYPAQNYQSYKNNSKHYLMPQEINYRHPVTGLQLKSSFDGLTRKALARASRFLRVLDTYVSNEKDFGTLEKTLLDYSLNTGLVKKGAFHLRYFNPILFKGDYSV